LNRRRYRLFRRAITLQLLLLSFYLHPFSVNGQLNAGGIPASRVYGADRSLIPVFDLPPPDLVKVAEEDSANPLPYRFAVNLPCSITMEESGNWQSMPDGSRICLLTIRSAGAKALSLLFDRFHIPAGGTLHVYSDEMKQLLGAYTSANNNPSGLFAVQLLRSDLLTLEYHQPLHSALLPEIRISGVAYAYRGFGGSGPCEVNVNCEEGQYYQEVKKGVVRIQVVKGKGSSWCSGSLINNTRNDGTPYVLSADHCYKGATPDDLNQWIFYFNYEASGCDNPPVPPQEIALTGATLKARAGDVTVGGSDFLLLLLNDEIPDTFDVYLNGWSRINAPSSSGVGIHHPEGDIKKISTYQHKVTSTSWTGGNIYTHWLVNWDETANGHGVTEFGSSGSALFDSTGMIIGSLTGGASACDTSSLTEPDYYGKLSYSWLSCGTDSTVQLQHWLDPDGTGAEILGGMPLSINPPHAIEHFSVYPNPSSGSVWINHVIKKGKATLLITFFDSRGMAVKCETRTFGDGPEEFDIRTLSTGLYVIRIWGEGHNMVQKIIKY
jgi:hypothetical protein